jgi:hypothetical protein
MNRAIGIMAVALISLSLASTAHADYPLDTIRDTFSNDGEAWDLSDSILGDESAWDFGGWVAAGYASQQDGLFFDYNGFHLTQGWLYVEKSMDTSEGFDWGLRVDTMAGTDADDTQSFGNDFNHYDFGDDTTWGQNYGLAAPQAYIELGYKDLAVKGGKFYTPVGYEVVTAPDNFFFSHAMTMFNSEPFTHTGFLATYSGIENVTVMAGWSAGWDTGFDQVNGGSNFLGGVSIQLLENVSLTYTTTAGNLGAIGDEGYTHSFVLDTQITENLNYVIQSDYTDIEDNDNTTSDTIGVNQYLFYTVNDFVSVGTRMEWWESETTNYYAATAGVNLQILPNLTARPEFRYQFSPDVTNGNEPNVAGLPVDEGIFAIDFVATF